MIFERIPGERFSRVLPTWQGRTVALLAGGPSLTPEQFALVRRAREADALRTIAINDSYLLAPWADVHYAADHKWHRWHVAGIDKPAIGLKAEDVRARWAAFAGEKATIQNCGGEVVDDTVHILRNRDHPNLGKGAISRDPAVLVTGRHGGFQALNLAILAGAARVLLLGYDARSSDAGAAHWHGEHPTQSPREAAYEAFRRTFTEAEHDIVATGVAVLNCSLTTRIDTFPKVSLEAALEDLVSA